MAMEFSAVGFTATLSSSIYYVMVVSDGRCMHHPWRKKSLNFFLLSKENLLGNSELRLATWYVKKKQYAQHVALNYRQH